MQSDIKAISVEKVRKLTELVSRVTSLLPEDSQLRLDLQRESVAFFSHVSLAVKGTLAISREKISENLNKICICLYALKQEPSLQGLQADLFEAAYSRFRDYFGDTGEKYAPSDVRSGNNGEEEMPPFPEHRAPSPLSERQKFMLGFAAKQSRFQLKELITHFPSLSEKTVRNDLLVLCEHGFVERKGVAPRSFYQVSRHAELYINGMEVVEHGAEDVVGVEVHSVIMR